MLFNNVYLNRYTYAFIKINNKNKIYSVSRGRGERENKKEKRENREINKKERKKQKR